MIALDEIGSKPGSGSARSVPGFDVCRALAACSHHLLAHGGHAAAAGLKIDEQNVDAFRNDFCEYVTEHITAEQRIAELSVDAEVFLSELTLTTVEQIQQLAPFGHSNPRPAVVRDVTSRWSEPPKRMGGGRPASLAENCAKCDQPARRGLWRRRVGGRSGAMCGPTLDRVSAGDQRISRPAERRTARCRLARCPKPRPCRSRLKRRQAKRHCNCCDLKRPERPSRERRRICRGSKQPGPQSREGRNRWIQPAEFELGAGPHGPRSNSSNTASATRARP